VRGHGLTGITSFYMLTAHIMLSTLGYAASTQLGIWGTLVDFVVSYPGMLLAVAGTVALTVVVVTSVWPSCRSPRARWRRRGRRLVAPTSTTRRPGSPSTGPGR
jgi:hypothetical protein